MSETKQQHGTALAANVDKLPANVKAQELKGLLTARLNSIEDVLPSQMKGEGQRLVNRAALYFATKKDLHNFSMSSIVIAVTQSCELGIPLDGRLGHIGSFGGDAVFMPDYKGLVMIAKRSRQIADCYGDFVGVNDLFECGRQGAESICNHSPNLEKRGAIKGAYAIVVMPDRTWRYEYMTKEQIDAVRKKSRAQNGPWKTDEEQMTIKTVVRRILKLYVDDPTFVRAMEIDDAASGAIDVELTGRGSGSSRVRPSSLSTHRAAPSLTIAPPNEPPTQRPEPKPEPATIAEVVNGTPAATEPEIAFDPLLKWEGRIAESDGTAEWNKIEGEIVLSDLSEDDKATAQKLLNDKRAKGKKPQQRSMV